MWCEKEKKGKKKKKETEKQRAGKREKGEPEKGVVVLFIQSIMLLIRLFPQININKYSFSGADAHYSI